MLEELRLRQAEYGDEMDLAALAFVSWEQGILPLYKERRSSREALVDQFNIYCRDRLGDIVVAELHGEVVGWCSRLRRKAYIPYLFVAPHMQGRGIGGMLLKRMESIFELEGYAAVHLETPADHVNAVHFYENQGYNILAMKMDGTGAHKPFMSVRLEKKLKPFNGIIDEID